MQQYKDLLKRKDALIRAMKEKDKTSNEIIELQYKQVGLDENIICESGPKFGKHITR